MREMKDSGLSWLKMVPHDWKNETIRHLLIARDGGVWGDEVVEDESGTICMRIADFDYERGRFKDCDESILTKRKYPDIQIKKLKLKKGDILVEKSGGGEKTPVGRAVLFDKDYLALFANFMERLRFNSAIVIPEYVEYWLKAWYSCRCSPFYINQTTGIQNINLTLMLAKERIYYPAIADQANIVSFLNAKCADINSLAVDIQAQIDTLEQHKRSVITETVTKGLNPYSEMRDSEIHWVDKLPSHWDVIPSKYLFRNSDLRKRAGDVQLTASQSWGIIPQEEYMERTGAKIVFANQGLENWKHVEPDDFVISLRSFQGGLEMSTVTGCITWHYVVLKAARPIVPRFYKWLFKSDVYIAALQRTCNFIRDGQDLRYSNFSQVPLYIPPMNEQKQIADYLDDKCLEIDTIIAEKRAQKNVLGQYKKSLIFEYVTGKKEVTMT